MRIIVEAFDPCNCVANIFRYLAQRQQSGFRDLGPGSVIECECGQGWTLVEDQGVRRWVEERGGYDE